MLGDGSGRNDGKAVADYHVDHLAVSILASGEGDSLADFAVSPAAVDERGVESVDVEVVSSEGEA